MSNDGRSIGDHLREIEESISQDSSMDSSATRQPERGRESGGSVTNRAASEEPESKRRVPPKRRQG
jgi:hypothetical protein